MVSGYPTVFTSPGENSFLQIFPIQQQQRMGVFDAWVGGANMVDEDR